MAKKKDSKLDAGKKKTFWAKIGTVVVVVVVSGIYYGLGGKGKPPIA